MTVEDTKLVSGPQAARRIPKLLHPFHTEWTGWEAMSLRGPEELKYSNHSWTYGAIQLNTN